MTHCYHCGADSRPVRAESLDVPTCEIHGPLWLLVRVGAAADVLVEREGKLLLVRRATDPFVDHWASVGGFVDPGESPADAARR